MANNGIHRKVGGVFVHAKPGLCERCRHRRDYGDWEGYCVARDKILSYKPVAKPRCTQFEEQAGATHAYVVDGPEAACGTVSAALAQAD